MYLSKSFNTMRHPNSIYQYARMGFAAKEYDVAVIGGGPGGEYNSMIRKLKRSLENNSNSYLIYVRV